MLRKDATADVKHSAPMAFIKAAPDETGKFEGYGSVFNNVDLYGEKVVPGAFIDSLVARKRPGGGTKIRMFWSHDPAQPIGKWLDAAEDSKGLFMAGQLNLDVQRAKEIHSLMKDEAIDGLSIGYRVQEADFADDGVLVLKKLDLLEVSVVSIPANPKATIDEVKSQQNAFRFAKFCADLKAGNPPAIKEFEDILREAGVPKSMATAIASVGYAKAVRSESESRKEAFDELAGSLAGLKFS